MQQKTAFSLIKGLEHALFHRRLPLCSRSSVSPKISFLNVGRWQPPLALQWKARQLPPISSPTLRSNPRFPQLFTFPFSLFLPLPILPYSFLSQAVELSQFPQHPRSRTCDLAVNSHSWILPLLYRRPMSQRAGPAGGPPVRQRLAAAVRPDPQQQAKSAGL